MKPEGFLPLDKPRGISSQQAVTRVKKITGCTKAGHTGTLDPLASGLLVIALGRATRLCRYFLEGDKGYRAVIRFGTATATGDGEGEITAQAQEFTFSDQEVDQALAAFRGGIRQKPPAASAIKIGGKRAYELFRRGESPEIPWRQVEIKALERLSLGGISPANPFLSLNVLCSKGTYIRSLAADLGQALGCPAHLSQLVRTQVSRVDLAQAATFSDLEKDYRPWLLEMGAAVTALPRLEIQDTQVKAFIQGRELAPTGLAGEVAVFWQDRLAGIALATEMSIKPQRVLLQEHDINENIL